MNRPFIKRRLLGLLLSIGVTFWAFSADTRFTCETFDGAQFEIAQWPVFIITSHSREDIKETLSCASLAGSLEDVPWLIDFAWPQPEAAKRFAAQRLLKSPFMKSRSTVLPRPISGDNRIVLVDSEFRILWSSSGYPSDTKWETARALLEQYDRR